MSRLIVHTGEIEFFLTSMHDYYSEQEEIIQEQVKALNEVRGLLAAEDLTVIQSDLENVEDIGSDFTTKKMPPLHSEFPLAKPLNPYHEAISNINQLLKENDIRDFNRRIRDVQPLNRTTAPKDSATWKDVGNFTGEITGYNDGYRVVTGKDPITGEELSGGEYATAVAWTLLTIIPLSKIAKGGKAAKGTKAVKGVKQLTPKDKLSKLKNLTNEKVPTVKKKLNGLTEEQLKAFQDFYNKFNKHIQMSFLYRNPALVGGPNNVLSNNQIYVIKNSDDVISNGNVYDNIKIKDINHGVNFGKYSTSIDDKVKVIKKEDLPGWIKSSFSDGNYRTVITEEDITFYRTYGGEAKANGSFVTTSPAGNRINAKIDAALVPDWKNTREFEAVIEVPKGQILNIGRVEKQYTKTGTILEGDADQILLPQDWPTKWIKDIREVPSK